MRNDALVGRKVAGRFLIQRFLGEGGMASVYVAERDAEPRHVALKIISPDLMSDRSYVRRFQREAKAASRVKHPNSVEIFEYGIDGSLSYIVMELLAGDDLYVLLERRGALSQTRAVRILAEVCDALSAAHEMGVVHRDLKPENIMVLADPSHPYGERVKVLDFGIAKILDLDPPPGAPLNARPGTRPNDEPSLVTRIGTLVGTPAYMSPEQCGLQPVDTRADIYTCGVLLFQLVTGRLPFEGETPLHTATLHIHAQPPAPSAFASGLAPRLEALILKALSKKPGDRYQTAAQLGAALRNLLPELPDAPAGRGPLSKRQASMALTREALSDIETIDASHLIDAESIESARTLIAGLELEGAPGPEIPPATPLRPGAQPPVPSTDRPTLHLKRDSDGLVAKVSRPGQGAAPAGPATAQGPGALWTAAQQAQQPMRPLELPPESAEGETEESTLTLPRPSDVGRAPHGLEPASPEDSPSRDSAPAPAREVKTTLRSADEFKLRPPGKRVEFGAPPPRVIEPKPMDPALLDMEGVPKRVVQTIRMANPNTPPASSPLPSLSALEARGSLQDMASAPTALAPGPVPPGPVAVSAQHGDAHRVNPLAPTEVDLPFVPVPSRSPPGPLVPPLAAPPSAPIEVGWMSGRRGLLIGFVAGMLISIVALILYYLSAS